MAKIPENVLDILGQCKVKENTLFLPDVRLDRKDYVSVNKVLENMGGKWNRKAGGHVFQAGDNPADMLEAVLLTQEVRDLKKEYQFFPTPRSIAERMCKMAELRTDSAVLEPSCGNGQLADVIMEHTPASLFCIELNPDMVRKLEGKPYQILCGDFLTANREDVGECSRVIMNPPFTRFQDIDHILHAFELLADGGVLVSVVCESAFFRSNKKAAAFREFLSATNAEVVRLEAGAFHDSGTEICTRLIKVRKQQ